MLTHKYTPNTPSNTYNTARSTQTHTHNLHTQVPLDSYVQVFMINTLSTFTKITSSPPSNLPLKDLFDKNILIQHTLSHSYTHTHTHTYTHTYIHSFRYNTHTHTHSYTHTHTSLTTPDLNCSHNQTHTSHTRLTPTKTQT
jgi:hypothetical protein